MSSEEKASETTDSPTGVKTSSDMPEVTKYTFRKQVWTHCEKSGLVSFPRPLQGRIPNFPGAPEAAAKLAELDIFKNATCVRVNTDKPQESVRILALEQGKQLIVPALRAESILAKQINLPEGASKADLRIAASRSGMLQLGKDVDLSSDLKIDLLVLGSVAVSRDGRRIGKGDGFSDLQYALLVEIGAVTEKTVIATTVHESQVFDSLPGELFKSHDVPVDLIVTPTEVHHITEKLPRPTGVEWGILSKRKMALMPILKVLWDKLVAEGKECHLKEEDTDAETEKMRRRLHQIRKFMRHPRKRMIKSEGESAGKTNETNVKNSGEDEVKTKKPGRRRKAVRMTDEKSSSNEQAEHKRKLNRALWRLTRRPPIQFSLRVGNISSNVRVRDLKNALAERNVKPTVITWRGQNGFAFLHFAKLKKAPENPIAVENIMASLQDMKISSMDEGATLLVEPAQPKVRVETTDVTAV